MPDNPVTLVAISSLATKQIEALHNLGIKTILIPPYDKLQKAVNTHADMVLFHRGYDEIILHNYSETLNNDLRNAGFKLKFTTAEVLSKYPNDIQLNSFLFGKYFVGSKAYSKDVAFSDFDWECINTKQGYAKCSSIILNEKAVITSDLGIQKALQNHGFDSIYVNTKGIALKGYDCGFIGGTCFKIDKDTLVFTGNLTDYHDKDKIFSFCKRHKISVKFLCNEPLIDFGSIIPLKMKKFGCNCKQTVL